MDLGAAHGFQGLRLGQGGLILGRDPSVTYQGHQNSLFAVLCIANKRPFVNECKQVFSRQAGHNPLVSLNRARTERFRRQSRARTI